MEGEIVLTAKKISIIVKVPNELLLFKPIALESTGNGFRSIADPTEMDCDAPLIVEAK